MTHIVAEDTSALWLHTLQRAVARASHDVKDALNGVSVNVEVIRSRAARADIPASAVAQFGEAAGHQLERLTTLLEAVLSLSRAEREPVDVALALRRIATLCGAASSSADARVTLGQCSAVGSTTTRVTGDVVRLAIAAPLLDLVSGTDRAHPASEVVCSLVEDADTLVVTMTAAGRRASMPESIADSVRAGGVRWTEGQQDLSLAFPRA